MYVCGVTPNDVTHLGHASTFVWADVAARVIRLSGSEVSVCRNVTDVDDVLTAAARSAGAPYDRFAAVQQFAFDRDMAGLGVRPPNYEPRAHRYVPAMVALATALVDAGAAYVRAGNVYFRGGGVAERAGLDRTEALRLSEEFGDDPRDPDRDDPLDVPLWRRSGPDEPAWPGPWGDGRPGWHAECAAMALATFGPSLDLHVGGADLIYPHHAYEAAQAEALTGVRPFARSWMHIGTVRVGGAKMAKSTGNLVLVTDLLGAHPAARVRLLLLDRPWREPWDYSEDLLERAGVRLDNVYTAAGRTGGEAGVGAVRSALFDDLDVPRAVEVALEAGGAAARLLVTVLALHDDGAGAEGAPFVPAP
jgi:cysteinyl-tRNA synthetase